MKLIEFYKDLFERGALHSLQLETCINGKKDSVILSEDKSIDNDSIYEIGSITKIFTSYLFMMAIEEGRASYNQEIGLYFNTSNEFFNKIKIIELLNHYSGLSRLPLNFKIVTMNPYSLYSREDLIDSFNFVQEREKKFNYSNYGYAILGLIAEKIYNESIESLFENKIIIPMRMTNTGFNKKSITGHLLTGEELETWDSGAFRPALGLKSTINDLKKMIPILRRISNGYLSLESASSVRYHDGATYGSTSIMAMDECGKYIIGLCSSNISLINLLNIYDEESPSSKNIKNNLFENCETMPDELICDNGNYSIVKKKKGIYTTLFLKAKDDLPRIIIDVDVNNELIIEGSDKKYKINFKNGKVSDIWRI